MTKSEAVTDLRHGEVAAPATAATPEQMADLEAFRALLAEWNGRTNLVVLRDARSAGSSG